MCWEITLSKLLHLLQTSEWKLRLTGNQGPSSGLTQERHLVYLLYITILNQVINMKEPSLTVCLSNAVLMLAESCVNPNQIWAGNMRLGVWGHWDMENSITGKSRMNIPQLNGFIWQMSFHNSDFTWASCYLRSVTTQVFLQQCVLINNKENIKDPHYWLFVKGIHWWLVSMFQGLVLQKAFPCHDIDGYVEDCSISITNALEILQSYTNPPISSWTKILLQIKQNHQL